MSAAATAAGYLYASGRLRGRAGKEEGRDNKDEGQERKRVRVAALPERPLEPHPEQPAPPKRTPTVQYRTKRWRPDTA
jgi:hypothetical protein